MPTQQELQNARGLSPQQENLIYNGTPCFLDMGGSLSGMSPLSGEETLRVSSLKIAGPILASFSKLKYLNSSNFKTFRAHFKARFLGGFMCPGNTFDNVKGSFPIGFLVWDLGAQG
nr:hypothetical protein [Helicobacter labacensis]